MDSLLAIITDEVSQDLDTVVRFAKEFELDGIELRSLFGSAFKDLSAGQIAEVKAACKAAQLKVAGCASPVFKCDLDAPDQISAHLDLFRRGLECAVNLEAPVLRVFNFLRKDTVTPPDHLKRVAAHLRVLIEIASESGVLVGIENEASCMMCSVGEIRQVCDELADLSGWGVVWDPCNIVYLPGDEDPVAEYPTVADHVIHVHVKDAARVGNGPALRCVELGKGQVNFASQFEQLAASDFRGWISLETHWRKVDLDDETQHLPAGYAFSAGGEEASRVCMGTLKKWLAAV